MEIRRKFLVENVENFGRWKLRGNSWEFVGGSGEIPGKFGAVENRGFTVVYEVVKPC